MTNTKLMKKVAGKFVRMPERGQEYVEGFMRGVLLNLEISKTDTGQAPKNCNPKSA